VCSAGFTSVLGGIYIGDDARIGANAVVLSDVPPAHVAVGAPARPRPIADASREVGKNTVLSTNEQKQH
jgi:serine acetyltransferase